MTLRDDIKPSTPDHPSPWLAGLFTKPLPLVLVELFVALSLAVNYSFLLKPLCTPKNTGDMFSPVTFWYLSKNTGFNPRLLPTAWRTRLMAPAVSSWFLHTQIKEPVNSQSKYPNFPVMAQSPEFQKVFGLYHAAWLFLTFVLLIAFRRDALLLILGIFAGLMYNFGDPVRMYCYPWDIPAIFFFTLVCLLFDRGRIWFLLPVIVLGALFKETVLCCALLVLFGSHWNWWKRTVAFLTVVFATFGINRLLMAHYDVQTSMLAMNRASSLYGLFHDSHLLGNIKYLFDAVGNHLVFANAGSLLLALLIPWHNRRDILFKVIILVFAIGQFFYGLIIEVRVWQELLPVSWMLVSEAVTRRWTATPAGPAETPDALDRLMHRSHWMTMSSLAAIALVIFAYAKTLAPPPRPEGKSDEQFLREITAAAENGQAVAQFQLANIYLNRQDLDNTIKWMRAAAEQGMMEAQLNLGLVLTGKRRDYAGAIEWLEMAAAQGSAVAQYELGFIYWNGLAGTQDHTKAFQLLQAAAEQGEMNAQFAVGDIYQQGYGGQPDLITAYKWYKLAMIRGAAPAAERLKACAADMTKSQIAAAEKLVKEFQEASQQPQ